MRLLFPLKTLCVFLFTFTEQLVNIQTLYIRVLCHTICWFGYCIITFVTLFTLFVLGPLSCTRSQCYPIASVGPMHVVLASLPITAAVNYPLSIRSITLYVIQYAHCPKVTYITTTHVIYLFHHHMYRIMNIIVAYSLLV